MGALLEKSPIALAFNRILCGPLSYKMKAHPSSMENIPRLSGRDANHERMDLLALPRKVEDTGSRPQGGPQLLPLSLEIQIVEER
jgi:hypothetical protein